MLAISSLQALALLFIALKGAAYDKTSMKMMRVTILISIAMFILDYLTGPYPSDLAALRAFISRIGLIAIYGIVLVSLSGVSMVVSKILSAVFASYRSVPDTSAIWKCLVHGLLVAVVAFALRWLTSGTI